ncbi:MAG TPA: hypothetical protein VF020_07765 [Chthoniobacterales bacterium]
MKKYLLGCTLGLALCATGFAQNIRLSKIYSKAIRPDCTRFEYVFSANNNTRHRLNLIGYACLLDADMNIIDKRFVSFETPAGKNSECSIESHTAPITAPDPGEAHYFRLDMQDNAFRRPLIIEGEIKITSVHKPGY